MGSIFLNGGGTRRGIHWAPTSDTHYVKLEADVIDGLTINGYSGVAFATGSRTNSTWAERMRMNINGNVGIGTTNPGYKLDVEGSQNVTTQISLWGRTIGQPQTLVEPGRIYATAAGLGPGNLLLQPTGGNVGIGTTNPEMCLHIFATADTVPARIASTGADSSIGFKAAADALTYNTRCGSYQGAGFGVWTANTIRSVIDNNGNMSIGSTNSTTYRLTSVSSTGNGTQVRATENTVGNGNILYVGSTTASNYGIIFGCSDTNAYNYLSSFKEGTGATGQMRFYSWTTLSGYYNPSGNWYKGDNTTTWSTTSDERVKENIVTLSSSISIIKSLRPVEFDYKKNKKHDVGFIAQEYEQVLPEQVYEDTPVEDDSEYVDGGKVKVISQNLTPYLVKALQEALEKIEQLEIEVSNLNSKLNT